MRMLKQGHNKQMGAGDIPEMHGNHQGN